MNQNFLKLKRDVMKVKKLKYQTEKHAHENILTILKINNEYHKKKYKNLNKKKILKTITELLVGSAPAVGSSTMGLINPGAGIIIPSSTALLTSITILITNEYISKSKVRYS